MEFLVPQYYYYVLVVFAICVVLMWVIVHSPFGKALQAIRDNEIRAAFIGIRIRRYRLIAFVISGIFTGVAGAPLRPAPGLGTPRPPAWTLSRPNLLMLAPPAFPPSPTPPR